MQQEDGDGELSSVTKTDEEDVLKRASEEFEKSTRLIGELREQLAQADKSLTICNALLPSVTEPQIAWAAMSLEAQSSAISRSSGMMAGISEEEEDLLRKMEETMKRGSEMVTQARNGVPITNSSIENMLERVSELLERCESPPHAAEPPRNERR